MDTKFPAESGDQQDDKKISETSQPFSEGVRPQFTLPTSEQYGNVTSKNALPQGSKSIPTEDITDSHTSPVHHGQRKVEETLTKKIFDIPLDPTLREIRTILLLPSTDPEATIQCEYRRQRLELEPIEASYSALSYVWGDGSNPSYILVDGASIPIGKNLFTALKTFRHSTKPLELWADALCIIQDDPEERASQVGLMGDIYERAHEVLIWLGEEKDDSSMAMELINHMGKTRHDVALWSNIFLDVNFKLQWEALDRLMKRTYWTRVWIVQEVLLGKTCVVCCGVSRAPWNILRALMGIIGKFPLVGLSNSSSLTTGRETNLAYSLAAADIKRLQGNDKMSLLDGLILFRTREATDPRDRVYAILSLVKDDGIEVDYSTSLFTLYRRVLIHVVERSKNLDIISACRGTDEGHGALGVSDTRMHNLEIIDRMSQLQDSVNTRIQEIKVHLEEIFPTGGDLSPMDDAPENRSDNMEEKSDSKEEELKKEYQPSNIEPRPHGTVRSSILQREENSDEPQLGVRTRHLVRSKANDFGIDMIELNSSFEDMAGFILPSWVPDWRFWVMDSAFINQIGHSHFKASGKTVPCVRFPVARYCMEVSGIRFDTVNAVALAEGIETTGAFHSRINDDWKMWCEYDHPKHVYGDQKQQKQAFVQTLLTGRKFDGTKLTAPASVSTINYLFNGPKKQKNNQEECQRGEKSEKQENEEQETKKREDVDNSLGVERQERNENQHDDSEDDDDSEDEEGFDARQIPVLYRRRSVFTFCATASGFMGCVPIGTKVGDIVVTFFGAKVPFILRKYHSLDRYYLIGDCCKFVQVIYNTI